MNIDRILQRVVSPPLLAASAAFPLWALWVTR